VRGRPKCLYPRLRRRARTCSSIWPGGRPPWAARQPTGGSDSPSTIGAELKLAGNAVAHAGTLIGSLVRPTVFVRGPPRYPNAAGLAAESPRETIPGAFFLSTSVLQSALILDTELHYGTTSDPPRAYVCGAGVFLSLWAWVAASAVAQSDACVLSPDRRNPNLRILRCGSELTITPAPGTVYQPTGCQHRFSSTAEHCSSSSIPKGVTNCRS
jgi:hypothetical protein